MSMKGHLKAIVYAPSRGLTRFALWWLAPPKKESRMTCRKCGDAVTAYRTYTNHVIKCIPCAEGLK
jgi:hypothetical protein